MDTALARTLVDAAEGRPPLRREQLIRFESYAAEMLEALGMDLGTPGTRETPRRFVQAMVDMTAGYEADPKLVTLFPAERQSEVPPIDQVVEGPITFFALCEHHAVPFFGRAYVGYLPTIEIIGISKLTRMVRQFSRRFTVQERLGEEIASMLEMVVRPAGVATYLVASHLCTRMRGVNEASARTRSTVWRGRYQEDHTLRSEFLAVCRDKR